MSPRPHSPGPAAPITRVDLFAYELTYVGVEYVMSRGRVVTRLESTVVKVRSASGAIGYGKTCPLGANYLPAHAAGARSPASSGGWPTTGSAREWCA